MPANTEHLYKQSDEAKHQLECIQNAADKAYAEITVIAKRFVLETLCSEKDALLFLDHVSDGIADMLADIVAQRRSERDAADKTIGDIEYLDFMRNRPVTI